jgi:toxin ParE1/3/4
VKLVWSATAARNIDEIWNYIAQDNLEAADRTIEQLRGSVEHLKHHPRMGRSGRMRTTRELIVVGTPYILVYRVSQATIEIVRILHGRQDWPPQE